MLRRICKYFGYTAVWVTVLVLALLLTAYLLVINSGFITKVALPVVSAIAGEEIEAEKFEISPFRSKVSVRNLRLGKVDEPLLTVGTLETGYGFRHAIGGVLRLHDTVGRGINLYLRPDSAAADADPLAGLKNLPDRLKINLENVTLDDVNLYFKDAERSLTLTEFNIRLNRLGERRDGIVTAGGRAVLRAGPDITVKSGAVKLKSNFHFARSPLPERLKLELRIDEVSGQIGRTPIEEQAMTVSAGLSSNRIGEVILHDFSFVQLIGQEKKSDITASGRFHAGDAAASLQIAVKPLSGEIIRPVAMFFTGIDPGSTQLFYEGILKRRRGTVSARGELKLLRKGPLVAHGEEFKVPEWDFVLSHDVTADYLRRDATVRAFACALMDDEHEKVGFRLNGGPLTVNLNAPPQTAFGGDNPGWTFFVNELALQAFNPLLARWFVLFGDDSAADVRIDGRLSAARGGFDLDASVRGDRFFMRIDDLDLEYVPTEYAATVRGNINPLNRIFTIDLASARQATARGDIGHAEVSGVWDLNTFVLSAHVNAGGVGNEAISQQPMIPNSVRDTLDRVMGKFFPAEYRFRGDAVLDLRRGFLRAPRGRVSMLQEGARQIVDISDFYINWDDEVIMGPCTAIVRLQDFDTRQITAWIPEGVPLRWVGLASGKVLYRMDGVATDMAADADLSINDLAVEFDKRTWGRLTLQPRFKIALSDYDHIRLDRLEISLGHASGGMVELSMAPTSGSISDPSGNPELDAELTIKELPLAEFNPLIINPALRFSRGVLHSRLNGNFKQFGRHMRLRGDMTLDNFAVQGKEIHGEQLAINSDFTLELDHFRELRLPMLTVHGFAGGRSMGGVTIQGELEPASGNGKFNVDILNLNHEAHAIFRPGILSSGTLRGQAAVELASHYESIAINSDVELSNLRTTAMTESMDGRAHLNYRHDAGVISSTGNTLLLNDLVDLGWDFDGKLLSITSRRLELLRLREIFRRETPEASSGEPAFNLPAITANLNLDGITLSPENSLRLNATVRGHGEELLLSPATLHVNETPVTLRADARSTADGIVYNVELHTENLDIDPVSTPLFEGSLKNLSGTAEKIDLRLSGRGLRYPAIWDHMNGRLVSSYRDISIPSNFQNTITGRLLFLPLRVVNEIRYQLGGIKNKQLGNAFSRIISASDHMRFNSGVINAEITDGRVKLDDVQFNGDFIRQLKFSGDLGFGSNPQMLVRSVINVEEVVLPITMRGTVYDPEPDYAAAIVQFAAINTGSFLKSIFGIFSSGTLQDMIEEISRTLSGN